MKNGKSGYNLQKKRRSLQMKEKKITREDILKMEGAERMKYEIAEEMGLLDKVLSEGWRSLSAKETGKIGGMMTSRKKSDIKK